MRELIYKALRRTACLDPMKDDNGRDKIWCETYTGKRIYPTDFKPEHVDEFDIAHSLAHQCRYNGHTTRFYSVAEHCVLIADYAMDQGHTPAEGFHALMHDAVEAYIGDIPRPIKCAIPSLKDAERHIEVVVCDVFGLPSTKPAWLEELDARIVVDERAQAKSPSGHVWVHDALEPLGVTIKFWDPTDAEFMFRRRFGVLTDMIKKGQPNE